MYQTFFLRKRPGRFCVRYNHEGHLSKQSQHSVDITIGGFHRDSLTLRLSYLDATIDTLLSKERHGRCCSDLKPASAKKVIYAVSESFPAHNDVPLTCEELHRLIRRNQK